MFVSAASIEGGAIDSYDLKKKVHAVKDTRKIGKHDMKYNGATPKMKVDPETFVSDTLPASHTLQQGSITLNSRVGGHRQ